MTTTTVKTELIQTKDYLLFIDEVNGFKRGDWNYEIDNTIPIYQFDYDIKQYPGNKIIGYYPLTEEAKELDLPLLPNPFEVEKLAIQRVNEAFGTDEIDEAKELCKDFWIDGYKAAQSKQFSLEDMEEAYYQGRNDSTDNEHNFKSFIQSLSTQQLPKEFVPNIFYRGTKGDILSKEDYNNLPIEQRPYWGKPIYESNNNSKGKEVLVGEYKY